MRNYVLAAIVGLAGLTVGAAVDILSRHVSPPVAAPALSARQEDAVASLPPPEPAPEATPTAPDASGPAAPGPAATAPPAPAASDLPNVDISSHAVHAVPSDDTSQVPTITLQDRNGRTLKELKPDSGLSPGYVPSVGPGGARSLASTARPSSAGSAPVLVPPVGGSRLAMAPSNAAFFSGAAQAAGGTTLSVGGRFVNLFGVRVADPRDQCGLGPGDNRSCAQVARDALAQRLARYPNVSCRVPAGQRGQPGAVCTDASGTDLGGFLVAEGYALADTSQSYDYFGAEGVARSYRRGLWRYR